MARTRRLPIWLLAATIGLAGCSVSLEPSPEPGPAPRPLESLDVPEPAPIDWRRTVAGIEVIGSGTRPDPDELVALAAQKNLVLQVGRVLESKLPPVTWPEI